jgi:Cu-Zn family superoxide dismutase
MRSSSVESIIFERAGGRHSIPDPAPPHYVQEESFRMRSRNKLSRVPACLAMLHASLIMAAERIGQTRPTQGRTMSHPSAALLGGFAIACLAAAAHGQTATATLAPTAGNTAKGTVTFTQKGDKVSVEAKLTGLKPGGHGFHVHEKGDCSGPDGMSAGGHFNPTGKPHGDPHAPDHHAGDMPMLPADASGNATLSAELGFITVGSGATDLVGKSVIVHADADDFKTQPTGNSGARVACGVITKS